MEAQIREPLHGTYRGYELLTAPPPHSGVHVVEALNILENEALGAARHYASGGETLHFMAETLRRVYADRTSFLADPRFEPVPVDGLMAKAFARSRFDDINRSVADPKEYRKTSSGNPFAFQKEGARDASPRIPIPHLREPG